MLIGDWFAIDWRSNITMTKLSFVEGILWNWNLAISTYSIDATKNINAIFISLMKNCHRCSPLESCQLIKCLHVIKDGQQVHAVGDRISVVSLQLDRVLAERENIIKISTWFCSLDDLRRFKKIKSDFCDTTHQFSGSFGC